MDTVPDSGHPPTNNEGVIASVPEDSDVQKLNGSKIKSILKVKAEAVIKTRDVEGGSVEGAVSPTSPTDIVPIISQQPRKPPRKKVHGLKTSTTLSYDNPAFENADKNAEIPNGEQHLSDVVDKMLDFKQDKHDWHPFGRISMYEEVLSGKHKHGLFESEKIILWFIFTILLVGMAGGIIFLSETYISTKTSNQTNETGVELTTM